MSQFTVLYTSDTRQIVKFWKELGIFDIEDKDDIVVVKGGNLEYHYVLDITEPFGEYRFATVNANKEQGILNYFFVEDINSLFEKVSKLSPGRITEIKKNHWNGEEFLFSDPDGHLFVAYKQLTVNG